MSQLHALIIGVENYPHLENGSGSRARETFGLQQLTSPFPSALGIAEALQANYRHPTRHLGTMRICIAGNLGRPDVSPTFRQSNFDCRQANSSTVRAAFDDWVLECDKNEDDLAFFYFCGHGIRRSDRLLLLEEFGCHHNRPFEACINFEEILEGMRSIKAQTQCFLVDACQESPYFMGEFRSAPKVLPWIDSSVAFKAKRSMSMPSILQVFSSQPGGLSRAPINGKAPVSEDFCNFLTESTGQQEITLGELTVELSKRQLNRHLQMGDFPSGEVRLEGHPGASFCSTFRTDKTRNCGIRNFSINTPCDLIESLSLRTFGPQGILKIIQEAEGEGWTIETFPAIYILGRKRRRVNKLANLEQLNGAAYVFGTGSYPRLDFSDLQDVNTIRIAFFSGPESEAIWYSIQLRQPLARIKNENPNEP